MRVVTIMSETAKKLKIIISALIIVFAAGILCTLFLPYVVGGHKNGTVYAGPFLYGFELLSGKGKTYGLEPYMPVGIALAILLIFMTVLQFAKLHFSRLKVFVVIIAVAAGCLIAAALYMLIELKPNYYPLGFSHSAYGIGTILNFVCSVLASIGVIANIVISIGHGDVVTDRGK